MFVSLQLLVFLVVLVTGDDVVAPACGRVSLVVDVGNEVPRSEGRGLIEAALLQYENDMNAVTLADRAKADLMREAHAAGHAPGDPGEADMAQRITALGDFADAVEDAVAGNIAALRVVLQPLKGVAALPAPKEAHDTSTADAAAKIRHAEAGECAADASRRNQHGAEAAQGHSEYGTIDQVLVHLARDWSEASVAGTAIRHATEAVLSSLPASRGNTVDGSRRVRALVPGCGVGRLAAELSTTGLDVVASDPSYLMISAAAFAVEQSQRPAPSSVQLYPLLGVTSDLERSVDRLYSVVVPSSDGCHGSAGGCASGSSDNTTAGEGAGRCDEGERSQRRPGSLTLQVSDLASHASKYRAADGCRLGGDGPSFDVVATSFLLDVVPNVAHAIDDIACILQQRAGAGLWINIGPLAYHSAASRVWAPHFSWEEIVWLAEARGFRLESHDTQRNAEAQSLCRFWAAKVGGDTQSSRKLCTFAVFRLQ